MTDLWIFDLEGEWEWGVVLEAEWEWVVVLEGELQIPVVYPVDGSLLDLVEYRVEAILSLCATLT